MRETEDILDKELKALKPDGFIALYFKIHREIILKLFKDIQTEAFNEAIELAAEKAVVEVIDHEELLIEHLPPKDGKWAILPVYGVDDDSILKLKI